MYWCIILGFRHTSVFRIFFPIVAILVIYYVIRFMMQSSIKEALTQIENSHNPCVL